MKHIIVCGHYDCGGVRAAMRNYDHGLVENWVIGIKDVARIHSEELNVRHTEQGGRGGALKENFSILRAIYII